MSGPVLRRVLVPFGTRPEIIKLAPVVRALRAAGHTVITVDTGQHVAPEMASDVQRDLGLVPDVRLRLPEGADRLSWLVAGATRVLASHQIDLVLALGDTHTVPAYALAARSAGLPFAHLEAGLRSFNERSLEEANRRVAGVLAQLHFAPTDRAAEFLVSEGVSRERIAVVGNPVIDAVREHRIPRVDVERRSGVLVTAHRASNVDDPDRLRRLVELVAALAARVGPVLFPVHPRTEARLREHNLAQRLADIPGVTVDKPLPYPRMLRALAGSRLVVTDSGGLQEEAAYYGVPVVLLRRSTPRWEGVEQGSTVLVGLVADEDIDRALVEARRLSRPDEQARIAALICPYGNGTTSRRVAGLIGDPDITPLLTLSEPDFTNGRRPWDGT